MKTEPEYNTTPEETQERVAEKVIKKGKKEVDKKIKTLQQLEVTYVSVTELRPNLYNPNRQDDFEFELLCRSMKEDGFTQPIIALKDGTIVDGEHRWRAATTIGFKEIPVVYVDMSPEQMRIATLRHNRARGSEDMDLSVQVLRDLEQLGAMEWAMDSLQLNQDEVDRLLEDVPVPELLAAEEFSPAWVPGETDEAVSQGLTMKGEGIGESASRKAVIDIRERERLLKEAKTQEQRMQIQKEKQIYRLSLIFSDKEAEIVKSILGKEPANKILELCKKEWRVKEGT